MSASKPIYLQGETATITVADKGYIGVSLQIGVADAAIVSQMTLSNGVWTDSLSTADLAGAYRFAVLADGALVEEGTFSVRVLVSKYRKVVAAIDAAMQKTGRNGLSSVSVGEITLNNKSFDEMQKWRGYYLSLAAQEETGETSDSSAAPFREDLWL